MQHPNPHPPPTPTHTTHTISHLSARCINALRHPPQAANELQRSGSPAFTLEDIDFGRRVAVGGCVCVCVGGLLSKLNKGMTPLLLYCVVFLKP